MLYSKIETRQGRIALCETAGHGFPLLLIHGNSSGKDVFARQLESPLGEKFRLIALDLPGHGQSDDARDPRHAYTLPGLAQTVAEILDRLGVERLAVLGWSLGGHVGLELLDRDPRLAGLMLVGTPPVSRGILGILRGFHAQFDLTLTTKGRLRRREIDRFAALCFGDDPDPDLRALIERTDWRARRVLGRSMLMGLGADQKTVAEHAAAPIAVVNGEAEPFARLDYLSGLSWGHLWDGRCHVLANAAHAPFREQPERFNMLLDRFVMDAALWAAHADQKGRRRA